MKLGKNQVHALTFARSFPGWHSFDRRCRATVSAVKRLAARGLVEIYAPGNQFRAKGGTA